MKNSRGRGKNSMYAQGIRFPHFPDTWSSYSISFLSEDLFRNRCSSSGWTAGQRRSTQFPLCNIWFTWTIIPACQTTDPKVSDVAVSNEGREKSRKEHVPRIRCMSKFNSASFSGADTCERTHSQVSLCENFSFISTFFSFFPSILHPLFLPNREEFPSMGPRCEFCVTPAGAEQSQSDQPRGPKALWDPDLARNPGPSCTTLDMGL